MKKTKNNKRAIDVAGVIIALVLIVLGVVLIVLSIHSFNDGVEDNQDRLLRNEITAVDYNINDAIEKSRSRTEALAASDRFRIAVTHWQKDENDSGERVRQILENNAASNMAVFRSMFISGDDEYICSNKETEYSIISEIKEETFLCRDKNGSLYVAVGYKFTKDLTCYAVLDMCDIYNEAIKRSNSPQDSVMIVEPAGGILIFQQAEEVQTCKVSELDKTDVNMEEAKALCDSQNSGQEYYGSYDRKEKKEKLTTRINAIPSGNTDNGIFGIGVSTEYDIIKNLVNATATRLMLDFAIVAIGLFILMLIFLRGRREKRFVDQELERLREKTEQMEALNEKTQELAHHQRLETIGTLTSSIAHEFNNLLTPIMGYSMMTLGQIPQDSPVYDDILEIYNSSIKAKEIISRLSELSRKNTEQVFKPMIPDMLVNKVLRVTSPALPKNVDIFRKLNCSDRRINGNETQLSQLLLNLIINAFQAMKDQNGEITISTRAEGGFIIFSVSDNGPGISRENIEKIFDPFFTTKESGEGTGLGLAIALQAAEDHKGRLEVESEEGKGTSFMVYIPEMEGPFEDDIEFEPEEI